MKLYSGFKAICFGLPILILIACQVTAQQQTEKGQINIDGVQLQYVAEGTGTPCLVIGSSVYYPRVFSENLKKSLKMYFVDMRWFASGDAKTPVEEITLQTIADDIELIRKELKLEKMVLIGHSIHGNVALDYVRRYPEHVTHLVMIGSPALWGSKKAEELSAAFRKQAEPERITRLELNWKQLGDSLKALSPADAFIKRYVTNGPLYWYDYTFDCSYLWKGVPVNTPVLNHLFQKHYTNYDLAASDITVKTPVLAMLGKHDYVVPYTGWSASFPNLPNLKIAYFEKSGHTPQLEEMTQFDIQIMDWLSKK
jgi:proline iminopeptidase